MHPSSEELKTAAKHAVRKTFLSLKEEHPERFYFLVLTTCGKAPPPSFSAWSHEALAREAARQPEGDGDFYIKWSYGESPYFCYHEENFAELSRLFYLRPTMDTAMSEGAWLEEYQFRIDALVLALSELDDEGLFGVGEQRHQIVINVEVMPPDDTNTENAILLNPPESLVAYLSENDQS